MSPPTAPRKLADPRRWSLGSPALSNSQAGEGRLEPGDAGLAGVRLKDDFQPFDFYGLVLICKAVLSVLFGKENTPLPGAGMGTGSHCNSEELRTVDAATGKQEL